MIPEDSESLFDKLVVEMVGKRAGAALSCVVRSLLCAALLCLAVLTSIETARSQFVPPELLDLLDGAARDRGPVRGRSDLDDERARARDQQPGRSDLPFGEFAGGEEEPEPSPLEDFYNKTLSTLAPPDGELPEIWQFGYDIFHDAPEMEGVLSGAIPDDYVLGVGDSLVFTFRGPESKSIIVDVDREGRIILPDMRPIQAANRTFGDFRGDFQAEVEQAFVGANAYVSLGSLRSISVLVLGELEEPGQKQLTSLSTIFDAMHEARGIRKSGSLRDVTLVRRGKKIRLDLYDLIQQGDFSGDIALQDGDRISVATIGGTFAMGGLINRPGIYEMPRDKTEIPFGEALKLAGGTILPGGTIFIQLTTDEVGRRFVLEADPAKAVVKSGDSIYARPNVDSRLGGVSLMGHVKLPGLRSIFTTPTVASLIPSIEALGDAPYTGLAVLRRTGENNFIPTYHPIDLQKVLRREVDFTLVSGDTLVVLGQEDVAYLNSLDVQNAIAGKELSELSGQAVGIQVPVDGDIGETADLTAAQKARARSIDKAARGKDGQSDVDAEEDETTFVATQCQGLIELVRIRATERANRFANAVRGIHTQREDIIAPKLQCPAIFQAEFGDLLPFLLEHSVEVAGEVRRPGIYPVAPGINLDAMLKFAGDLTRDADQSRIELTRFSEIDIDKSVSSTNIRRLVDINTVAASEIIVAAADRITIQAKFTNRDSGPVLLAGEFRYPGIYDISRNTKLSDVIARAGGLTENAYPYGAIFTRESARREEERALQRFKKEIEDALTFGVTRGGERGRAIASAAPFLKQLAEDTENADAIGRIVVEADPTVLQVRTNLDPVLQPGDQLFMPKRPSTVAVTGEVLNPGSFQFISGASARTYIHLAGNFQDTADPDKAFIIYPDGTARNLATSAWRRNDVPVPPGSSIVVPRNVAPIDFLLAVNTATQILGQLTLTAAALNAIADND